MRLYERSYRLFTDRNRHLDKYDLRRRRALAVHDGIYLPVGTNLASAVSAQPAGTRFIIGAGTHTQQTFTPKTGQEFYAEHGAVLDGELVTPQAVTAFSGNPDNVILDGIIFENYAPAYQQGAVACGTGSGWLVTRCEVRESVAIGLVFNGNHQIIGNSFHHNRQSNLKGFGANGVVAYNEIAHGNYLGEFPGGGEGGGTKFLQSTNLTLRGNWVHNNYNGLWCDFNNDTILYEDNIVEDNQDNGIFQEYGYNATIRNNIVRNNGRDIRVTSCSNAEVYNNTVTASTSWIWAVERNHQFSGDSGVYRLRDLWVHDNDVTLVGGDTHGLRDNLQAALLAWDTAANNRWDFNVYTDAGAPAAPFFWENNQKYNFTQWQGFGNDLNGSYT